MSAQSVVLIFLKWAAPGAVLNAGREEMPEKVRVSNSQPFFIQATFLLLQPKWEDMWQSFCYCRKQIKTRPSKFWKPKWESRLPSASQGEISPLWWIKSIQMKRKMSITCTILCLKGKSNRKTWKTLTLHITIIKQRVFNKMKWSGSHPSQKESLWCTNPRREPPRDW